MTGKNCRTGRNACEVLELEQGAELIARSSLLMAHSQSEAYDKELRCPAKGDSLSDTHSVLVPLTFESCNRLYDLLELQQFLFQYLQPAQK